MNPCHFCGQPATIHLTDIVQAKKTQTHLCDACAREKGLIPDAAAAGPLDLQSLVQLILGQHAAAKAADPAALKCPECGIKYAQFRADGRLGCPHDYDAFRSALAPLLDRIHRADRHRGKAPAGARQAGEVADLRRELRAAVAAERYEDAAALRDRLREREGSDGPG